MSQTPQITEEEWESHKDAIISLYLGSVEGEIQGKGQTLNDLTHSMRETYGFTASESQFEARLKIWEARKNFRPEEWNPVLERLDMLPKATKSRVVISGRVAPRTKISRARKYFKDKSRNAALGHSISPSRLKQVRIEIQDPGGRWVQLSETNATLELRNCSPSRAEIPKETNTQLCTSGPAPAIPNELSVTTRNDRHLLDFDISRLGSPQYSGPPVSILMGDPSAWLQQLPSKRLLEKLVRINYNQNAPQIQDKSKRKTIGINETTSHFGLGGPGLGTLDIRFSSQGFQCHNGRNQSIIARDDCSRTKFTQYLLAAIMNGVHDVGHITGEALDGCLGPNGTLSSSLLSCFRAAPKYIATTLASGLFQASMRLKKQAVVAQFLEEGLSHANDSMVFDQFGAPSTPLELAASLGDEDLLDLFLSHKADPNKTCRSQGAGALLILVENHDPSLVILGKLFAAGAKVPPDIMWNIDEIENEVLSFITLRILPSQHTEFFLEGFWSEFISNCGDTTGAALVNKFLYDCVEHHSGQCISHFQEKIEWRLVSAAEDGHAETFLAIFPHCTLSFNIANERLLSASIIGKHPTIIDFVMSRRPNINPSPRELYPPDQGDPEIAHRTNPLAASITARNTEFINVLAGAGIFNSLHEGHRFEVAIEAAVETGDYELVARLLDSCPSLESHCITRALEIAIDKGHENIALMLLERGASVYTGKLRGPPRSKSLLFRAIEKGNLVIAQSLLTLGDFGHVLWESDPKYLFRHLLCLIDPSITENYLSSFHGNFRYMIDTEITPDDFDPNPKVSRWYAEPNPHRYISQYLLPALRDKKICDLILGSKLATVQFLTVCLAAAVSQNDPDLAQKLIEKGANAVDNMVLTCATRWGPGLVPLLIDGTNRRRNVVTKGLRTNVLKEAIRQGPKRADLVSLFIKSESVDISDSGDCGTLEALTPLGAAIRAATAFPQFSYDTVKLLLDHGVDADGIVNFDTRFGPPINKTAIIEAVSVGDQELVKLLVDYGAHVNLALRHMVRRTPLQMAAKLGDLEMAKLLIRHGADVNAEPCIAMGGTALQFAAISGNCDLAAELLQQGALLHKPPPKIGGRWPIEGAAEHGRLDMVQFLWTANEETLFIHDGENGFQDKNFKKAMRLAVENHKFGCRDLIAELTGLPIEFTDVPPIVSPMYVDWPPPGWSVD